MKPFTVINCMSHLLTFTYALLLLIIVTFSQSAHAEFSLDKYRITLDEKRKHADLRLYNTSSEFSSYRVKVIDMKMNEDGILTTTEKFTYSAKQLLRVSPRQSKNITPNSYQKIRIRSRGNKVPGEFRSHLLIEEVLAPYEGDIKGMILRPNLKMIIPIFVSNGKQQVSVKVTDFNFLPDTNELTFTIHRSGNRSAFGNILIESPQAEQLFRLNSVGIYREIDLRRMTVKLPENTTSVKDLVFKFEESDGATILFQQTL
ncbi:MAG: hypothetical protein MJK04_14790 [Psychrosphaera sp.]|nr:hypothetical protein [Psychrosphaera sp.]